MTLSFSILNPLMSGAMVAAEIGLLGLLMLTRKEIRHRDNRRVTELAEAHDIIAKMQARIDELTVEAQERELPVANGRRMTINLHPRAEALRMLRRGGDEHTVAETLNLPLADVTLLRKVSQILCAARD
ncbi:MAG: hypothetical protein WDO73_37185 [Ignavibacteriota bacterium]